MKEEKDESSIKVDNNKEESKSVKEAEKVVKPRSLYYIQMEARGEQTPTPIFQKLINMDFNMEEIMKTSEIDFLLGPHDLNKILETAKEGYEKWLIKAGEKFPESSQKKYWEEHKMTVFMDSLRDITLDYFAISSHERIKYRHYMQALVKRLKSYQKTEWVKLASELFNEWSLREDIEQDILKILTWLILKGMVWYEQKLMRSDSFDNEKLPTI
jgi:hypothetical protein